MVDRIAPAPGDQLVEVLRSIDDTLDRIVATAPIDRRHRLDDRMIGINLGHCA